MLVLYIEGPKILWFFLLISTNKVEFGTFHYFFLLLHIFLQFWGPLLALLLVYIHLASSFYLFNFWRNRGLVVFFTGIFPFFFFIQYCENLTHSLLAYKVMTEKPEARLPRTGLYAFPPCFAFRLKNCLFHCWCLIIFSIGLVGFHLPDDVWHSYTVYLIPSVGLKFSAYKLIE